MQPEIESVNVLKDELKVSKEFLASLAELNRQGTKELEIMRDLTHRIPEKYWLNYLLLEDDRLTIHGNGASPETLVELLDSSLYLDGVKLERVVNDRFTIGAQLQDISDNGSQDKESTDSLDDQENVNGQDEEGTDTTTDRTSTMPPDKINESEVPSEADDESKKTSEAEIEKNENQDNSLELVLPDPPQGNENRKEIPKKGDKPPLIERKMEKK